MLLKVVCFTLSSPAAEEELFPPFPGRAGLEGVADADAVSVAVTGHTVVYKAIVSVVTLPILAGQLVTVGAQDVIVYTEVVYTVLVVYCVTEGEEVSFAGEEVAVTPFPVSVAVTGHTVV